jgi:hypothetical protein
LIGGKIQGSTDIRTKLEDMARDVFGWWRKNMECGFDIYYK